MKAVLAPLLLLLAIDAPGALASPQALACKTTDLVHIGLIQTPHDSGWGLVQKFQIIVGAKVRSDGSLESLEIKTSSNRRGYDVVALERAKSLRLAGDCLHHGKGLLYLRYVFQPEDDKENKIDRLWREATVP